MKRRQLLLLFGSGSAAATSVGTSAFSSVEADRGVSVDVAEDENAYLGIVTDADDAKEVENTATVGRKTKVARLENKFSQDLTLDVTFEILDHSIDDAYITVDDEHKPDDPNISSGEAAYVEVKCGSGDTDAELKASIRGTTDDDEVVVDATREIYFKCRLPDVTVTGVQFSGGSGNIKIRTKNKSTKRSVQAKLPEQGTEYQPAEVNTQLKAEDLGGNGAIEAVKIKNIGRFDEPTKNGGGNVVPKSDAS
jgi:hypothetical protein